MIPHSDIKRNLAEIVHKRPFPEFEEWWEMGYDFIRFMSSAINAHWYDLLKEAGGLYLIQDLANEYLHLVYAKESSPELVSNFVSSDFPHVIHSGEFDALSYAFYRSAFEFIAQKHKDDESAMVAERRNFTIRVGKSFFNALLEHLQLNIPTALNTPADLVLLKQNLNRIGDFLLRQGYLRDHCEFTFAVDVKHAGKHIIQKPEDFLNNLHQNNRGYALYIMGYPAILPSAVYLYQLFGEAQHHSSRTIEELFQRVGYNASETADFNPTNYPSDKIVEFWSITP